MLKKFKIQVVLLLTFVLGNPAYGQAFSPTPQQIQQFKNMPKAQQEALAKQLGVNIADFKLGSKDGSNPNEQSEDDYQVQRDVNEKDISKQLAEQSAAKELTAELKPFGYSLFATPEDMQEQISFAPSANTPVPADYVMGPGDSVNVQLFGKETGEFELFVNNEGSIQVPDLGPMSVVGLTYHEFKTQLTEKYSQQVIGVTPHITMGKLRTIQVYMVGEAYRPGAFTLSSLSTITHALFASGGVNEIGSLRNIQLKRAGKTVVTFDLYDLLVFGNTENDKRLQQGDVIFIPTVQKLVSIDGNVRRPAIYEAKANETLQDLISIAGGALPSGAVDMIQIARKTPQAGLEVKTIDLISSTTKPMSLVNGDYINIPDANDEFSNAIVVAGAYATPGLMQWKPSLTLASVIKNNGLLNGTDLDYALVVRRDKFAEQSEVIQFEPRKVLDGSLDFALQRFDQITLFNRFGRDEAKTIEKQVTEGELKEAQDDIKTEQANYLQNVEAASFTEKQLLLKDTQQFSRKRLLAPIIARLKDEGTINHPVKLAEITGQVRYPGIYPISQAGRVADLIKAAGGLVESAFVKKAELSRTQVDVNGTFNVQHINIDLVDALLGNVTANQPLVSKDTLNVMRTPDWYDNRKVELVGEVVFPGTYQIKKNETLAQIIKRAGGFTTEASVRAAIFTREELKEREIANLDKTVEELRQQIITSNVSGSQNVKTVDYQDAKVILDELLSVEPVGRLVIDLAGVVGGDDVADIQLKDGDKLYVPSISPSVSVVGEVFVPTTHILEETITLDEYIDRSGGLTERADQSKIYIVKANGSVQIPDNNFWYSGESVNLEAGDTIVVPRDVVNYERLGLWQTVTQIFYQSAIALVAIGRL
ncbi:SLBB domain-containing protein [Aliiglaciecola sp. LCG003]|uniref:SLBB domain-containing protein n=1 Tax=Aliiglaciecola sp. LCG003 TaxID=3053655 RepID=UPI0025742E6B|nr:SLBB domain-containing protein [Aliiglaciecola sp. LCG003]WJG10397.1 SLBB domain-containing protein [Aliiglaciecola sp. LCG003]